MRARSFAILVSLATACGASLAACGGGEDDAAPSTAGGAGSGAAGAAGAAGLAGSAGSGGEEPEDVCTTKGVNKGPWVLAPTADGAKIRWQTCVPGDKSVVVTPEAGGAPTTVTATETSYELKILKKSIFPDVPPDVPGTFYLYEAAVTGLASGCHAYSVAGDATKKGRFCTSRKPGETFRFMSIGDTNPKIGPTIDVLSHLVPKGFDFTLHGGDIQYYSSTESWQYWFMKMQPMLSQGAFLPARGNHESEKENAEEYTGYTKPFFGGAGQGWANDHYETESGGVHFFALNTEDAFDVDSEQGKWLVSRLEAAKASPGFRFSVIYQHRPFFTCGDSDDHPKEQAGLEPAMIAGGVKLVLQAHMHGYERFLVNGITYVTSGGGGGIISDVSMNLARPYCDKRQVFGSVPNASLIEVTATGLSATAYDSKGVPIDAYEL